MLWVENEFSIKNSQSTLIHFTLFRMGLFRAAHGWGAKRPPFPINCHTYPATMKLATFIPNLPNEDSKNI